MSKNTVFIKKAQAIGSESVPDMVISITQTLSRCAGDAMTLEQFVQVFEDQAKDIEEALYGSLPGGTYDRLLGRMLQRKASHFLVTHKGSTDEASNA